MSESILFLPAYRPGGGTGHLHRALRMAAGLASQRTVGIYLTSRGPQSPEATAEGPEYVRRRLPPGVRLLQQEPEAGSWDFLLVDRRATTAKEFALFSRWGLPLGLDEGGGPRQRFPFLIDSLPTLPGAGPANQADTGFLDVPLPGRQRPRGISSVLVSFGGEDAAGLTEDCLDALLGCGFGLQDITVVKGPLFGRRAFPRGLRILDSPSSLAEHMTACDLVCTSFGLTAFEAAAAGALVVLINPTSYHSRLARLAGFPVAGTGSTKRRRLAALLKDPARLAAAAEHAAPSRGASLEQLLLALRRPAVASCPVCGRQGNRALRREPERSFFTCGVCGTVYQLDFGERGRRYTESYFFEEYRRQYGRTYLEDAAHIRALSAPRVRRLRRLLKSRGMRQDGGLRQNSGFISPSEGGGRLAPSGGGGQMPGEASKQPGEARNQSREGRGPQLLDVGCAYGPFLQAAREEGFEPAGTDISPEAVEYVRSTLEYPALSCPYEEYPEDGAGQWAAVTMWFVIEHFPKLDAVLRKTAALLPMGGVFAFSTPNLRGGYGRFYPQRFLRGSPYDHFTVWYPGMARRVLRRYGFKVEKIVITGHHPERLPGGSPQMGRLRRGILMALSKLAGWGDTFEVYARKIGDPR